MPSAGAHCGIGGFGLGWFAAAQTKGTVTVCSWESERGDAKLGLSTLSSKRRQLEPCHNGGACPTAAPAWLVSQ